MAPYFINLTLSKDGFVAEKRYISKFPPQGDWIFFYFEIKHYSI